MPKLWYLILIVLMVPLLVSSQSPLAIRKRIIPLHTTKGEIEKWLKPAESSRYESKYETKDEIVIC